MILYTIVNKYRLVFLGRENGRFCIRNIPLFFETPEHALAFVENVLQHGKAGLFIMEDWDIVAYKCEKIP